MIKLFSKAIFYERQILHNWELFSLERDRVYNGIGYISIHFYLIGGLRYIRNGGWYLNRLALLPYEELKKYAHQLLDLLLE